MEITEPANFAFPWCPRDATGKHRVYLIESRRDCQSTNPIAVSRTYLNGDTFPIDALRILLEMVGREGFDVNWLVPSYDTESVRRLIVNIFELLTAFVHPASAFSCSRYGQPPSARRVPLLSLKMRRPE